MKGHFLKIHLGGTYPLGGRTPCTLLFRRPCLKYLWQQVCFFKKLISTLNGF